MNRTPIFTEMGVTISYENFLYKCALKALMARFRCGNCNYSFEPKVKDKLPTRCPYCSTVGKLFEENSIIEKMDDDFEEM